MFFTSDIIAAVDDVASIRYLNGRYCKLWNKHRRDGELRMLTGWVWTAKDGSVSRGGFKTISVAYRDCYYVLVQHASVPGLTSRRPRLVASTKAA